MKEFFAAVMIGGLLLSSQSAIFPSAVQAAKVSKLEGFQELKWGDSVATVKAKLSRKYKFDFFTDHGFPVFLGNFGGYRHVFLIPCFKADKLYNLRVAISAQDGKNTLEIYSDIFDKITKVYGPYSDVDVYYFGNSKTLNFKQLKTLTDDEKLKIENDVLSGKATYRTTWEFEVHNYIEIIISRKGDEPGSDLYVGVDYFSSNTKRIADKAYQKAEEAKKKAADEASLKDF